MILFNCIHFDRQLGFVKIIAVIVFVIRIFQHYHAHIFSETKTSFVLSLHSSLLMSLPPKRQHVIIFSDMSHWMSSICQAIECTTKIPRVFMELSKVCGCPCFEKMGRLLAHKQGCSKNGGWEILSSEYDFFYQMVYCQFRDGSSHPSCQCADWNKTIKTKLPCKRFCAVLKIQHQMEWFEPIAQKPLHIKSRRDLPEPISSSIPGQSSGTRKGKLGLYLIVDL
jgi:hypothetical protein